MGYKKISQVLSPLVHFFRLWSFPNYLFSCYVRILERGSKRHREKSQPQLCWSISDFLGAFLVRFYFDFSDALFSPCIVCSRAQLKYLIFFLDEGHFPFSSPQKSPTSQLCANGVPSACLEHKYLNYTLKVNNTKNFQMSAKWKLETRILNNANSTDCNTRLVLHEAMHWELLQISYSLGVYLL